MITKPLSGLLPRFLLTAAVVSNVACTNRLRDYTQITMQASALDQGSEVSPENLAATQEILENRLTGLGVDFPEVEINAPDQIVVRLPQAVNVKAAEALLTNTGQLYLRNQKPDTEQNLAKNIEELQRLLVEQDTLNQTGKQAEAEALQAKINEIRSTISALFEPSQLTGKLLYDAKAQPSDRDRNLWEVTIRFDAEGADKFAEQTKLMAGTGRAVGLFLDSVLLSTPVVDVDYADTGITEGAAVISGDFTKAAAEALEVQLKSGALPVVLTTLGIVTVKDKEITEETAPE
ncbi:MAG: hypothetical protein WBA76_08620 [Phormidesmis sp.]